MKQTKHIKNKWVLIVSKIKREVLRSRHLKKKRGLGLGLGLGKPMKLIILLFFASCAHFSHDKKVKTAPTIEKWDKCTTYYSPEFGRKETHCYKFQVIGVTLGTTEAWSEDDGQIYVDEKEFILEEE